MFICIHFIICNHRQIASRKSRHIQSIKFWVVDIPRQIPVASLSLPSWLCFSGLCMKILLQKVEEGAMSCSYANKVPPIQVQAFPFEAAPTPTFYVVNLVTLIVGKDRKERIRVSLGFFQVVKLCQVFKQVWMREHVVWLFQFWSNEFWADLDLDFWDMVV